MINKRVSMVERVYSSEKGNDFNTLIELIITNKIEDLVHNANKVNTATSHQINMKGSDLL